MKMIYNYSPVTGEYIGSEEAQFSPLEPDVILMPAHATEIEPPEVSGKKVAVFANGAWGVVKDLRGTHFWMPDYSMHYQNKLGDLPDGATTVEPENHIGESYWLEDGSQHVMDKLGPMPEGVFLEKPAPKPPTEAEIAAAVTAARASAYRNEADPLFFKVQRGEATNDEWLAKVAEIKARYPDGVWPYGNQ